MAYELRAQLAAICSIIETADETTSPASDEAGRTRQFSDYNTELVLHGNTGSYPEIGGPAADLSLVIGGGGTTDIDLTAAPQANDIARTKDFTGKRLVALIYYCPRTNVAAITLGGHGGNAYGLYGTTTKPTFYPGESGIKIFGDRDQASAFTSPMPAVAAGAKDLQAAGTATDVMKLMAIFSE